MNSLSRHRFFRSRLVGLFSGFRARARAKAPPALAAEAKTMAPAGEAGSGLGPMATAQLEYSGLNLPSKCSLDPNFQVSSSMSKDTSQDAWAITTAPADDAFSALGSDVSVSVEDGPDILPPGITRNYDLLGVAKTATPEEIERAVWKYFLYQDAREQQHYKVTSLSP